ncbi:ABC transporter substrate-binding protein [Belliella marina]|uniref:ABC transporter substrate-binding protein n=1 Tax=Belliella marina TaxID=1644146 RepID=A0ABW4VR19_9BACT
MEKIILKGITWGHSRGLLPLQAYAQRFNELNPEVEIVWKKRTLQEFADFPIEELTKSYDLLIIDHPWVGCAAATSCVLPLDRHLPKEYLINQQENQVGRSHDSYFFGGHQWALAIDAATPVASYRKDLFEKNKTLIPDTWSGVLELAKAGKVAAPAIPIDLLMNFYMFCQFHGQIPFQSDREVVDHYTGLKALETMRGFYGLLDPQFFNANPIKVAEIMSSSDDYWYCPFAYGYSNYSRPGYARNILTYGNLVKYKDNQRLRSTLGGTGLAVSEFSANKDWALKYAQEIVSESNQIHEYTANGGQPGHRKAWLDERNNLLTQNFFSNTIQTLDESFIRPRYHGYLHFQDHAGDPIRDFLMGKLDADAVLEKVDKIYKKSKNV